MLFKEVLYLVTEIVTVNDVGNSISSQTKRIVFADKQSIRQNEFYQAQATGLRPELMFVIRSSDYANEQVIEYNGKQYNITRFYDKGQDFTELICQGMTGGK